VHLPAQVEQTLDLLRHPLTKVAVKVTTDFAEDLPYVYGDEDQIRQVLLNLVLNAVEAMPNGGHIVITGEVEGTTVILKLINDGPPIPDDALDHIFEPFFTTKPGGAGLGLFISHHIIQQHGGTLRVENISEPPSVAFEITLPTSR
jgi:signal transduction histidine kinase